MVKRKWLWKRSSLNKGTGGSETSGSMSSQSDKCAEEQEFTNGSPNQITQSPEVTLGASGDECNKVNQFTRKNSLLKKLAEANQEDLLQSNSTKEATLDLDGFPIQESETDEATTTVASTDNGENESTKLLNEKLSAALSNVSLKDELVKQHSKVAEEAVAGWEKAENEGASLKQQLDTAVQQNSTLEARLTHLDQALKECVRQLRLAKDEQERKISDALAEKINEFELSKSKLESRINELQAQVENVSANSPALGDPEIHLKLEFLERENQSLKHELIAQSEELEIRTIERDLSTKAAETASKQHLESIRLVAKLESECRKLKARSRNSPFLDKGQKSPSATSYSIDSITNRQSDGSDALSSSEVDQKKMNGSEPSESARSESWVVALVAEHAQLKNEKSLGQSLSSSSTKIDLMDDFLEMEKLAAMPENGHCPSTSVESMLREELKVIASGAAELQEKLQKMEAERFEVEMVLSQNQMSLENLQVDLIETNMKLEQLEAELREANELKMDYESYAKDLKLESKAMMSKIEQLQAEVDRKRVSTEKLSSRCQELENNLRIKSEELEIQRVAACNGELEEKEKALAESRKRLDELEIEIKKTVRKLEKQEAASKGELDEKEINLIEGQRSLEELQIKLDEAEMKLDTQNAVYQSEVREKFSALADSQQSLDKLQIKLREAENKLEMVQKELHVENETKEHLLSEINNARGEVETMSAHIDTLQAQIAKEHGISTELSAKYEELEKELKQRERELELRQNMPALVEQKINQEDLTNAAGKLAECQKTIASLGNQLKSLATLEDFLIDTASIPTFAGSAPIITNGGSELWKLHSNNVYLPQKRHDVHFQDPEERLHTFSKYVDGDIVESSASSSTNRQNCSNSEKRVNGFEKLFPMRRG